MVTSVTGLFFWVLKYKDVVSPTNHHAPISISFNCSILSARVVSDSFQNDKKELCVEVVWYSKQLYPTERYCISVWLFRYYCYTNLDISLWITMNSLISEGDCGLESFNIVSGTCNWRRLAIFTNAFVGIFCFISFDHHHVFYILL